MMGRTGDMEADASRYHGKAPDEIDWSVPERQTRAVTEFLGALDDEDGDGDRKPPKVNATSQNVFVAYDELSRSPRTVRTSVGNGGPAHLPRLKALTSASPARRTRINWGQKWSPGGPWARAELLDCRFALHPSIAQEHRTPG
jgi:hypothetical protein